LLARVLLCAVQQVAFADKILLNKIDLVAEADKAQVKKRIRVSSRHQN
jgi:G3E family GTPase